MQRVINRMPDKPGLEFEWLLWIIGRIWFWSKRKDKVLWFCDCQRVLLAPSLIGRATRQRSLNAGFCKDIANKRGLVDQAILPFPSKRCSYYNICLCRKLSGLNTLYKEQCLPCGEAHQTNSTFHIFPTVARSPLFVAWFSMPNKKWHS